MKNGMNVAQKAPDHREIHRNYLYYSGGPCQTTHLNSVVRIVCKIVSIRLACRPNIVIVF